MDDKIEINILDIRSNLIDLRTISEEDIKSLFPGNFWPNIYLTRRYKSILFNFAKKSNIESINMRNILVFPGVIPDINNAHAKPVKLMTIKPVITQHGKLLYLPDYIFGLKVNIKRQSDELSQTFFFVNRTKLRFQCRRQAGNNKIYRKFSM